MKRIGGFLVVVLLLMLPRIAYPQLLDLQFPNGAGPNNFVRSIAVQQDGQILVAGNFTNFNGQITPPIVRLHPDGSLDSEFKAGPFQWEFGSTRIDKVEPIPDGRILIEGSFTNIAGVSRFNIALLEANGTLDIGFTPASLLPRDARYSALHPASDGGFWTMGNFTNVGGVSTIRLAKLRADGSPDVTFRSPFTSVTNSITSLLPLPDGRLLISGRFDSISDVPVPGIARLETNGTLDLSFRPKLPSSGRIGLLTLMPDGNIILRHSNEGQSNVVDDSDTLIRLLPNGEVDAAYQPSFHNDGRTLPNNSRIIAMSPAPDGGLLISGTFLYVNGIQRPGFAKLNRDGSTDLCLDLKMGVEPFVLTSAAEQDGSVLIGGAFRGVEGQHRPYLARFRRMADCGEGTLLFAASTFRANEGSPTALITVIRSGSLSQSQSFTFSTRDGTASAGVDYTSITLSSSFQPGERAKTISIPLHIDSLKEGDETVALELSRSTTNGSMERIASATLAIADQNHFHGTGRVDTNFIARIDAPVMRAAALPDDSWLLAVNPTNVWGSAGFTSELRRMNKDGSIDPVAFRNHRFDGTISALAVLPNRQILVAGDFVNINERFSPGIARLHPDGTVDVSFAPFAELISTNSSHLHPYISDMIVRPDGGLVCSGLFPFDPRSIFRGQLIHIRQDGFLDLAFGQSAQQGPGNATSVLALPNGSYAVGLIGGYLSVGRFFIDGSRDPQFVPPPHTPLVAETLSLASDDSIIAGGSSYNLGIQGPTLARLTASGAEVIPFRENASSTLNLPQSSLTKVLVEPDGRILVAGSLKPDKMDASIVRLHADGTWDPSFDAGTGASPRLVQEGTTTQETPAFIYVIQPLSDGGWLVGGDFSAFNGFKQPFLIKLLPESSNPQPSTIRLSVDSIQTPENAPAVELELVRSDGAALAETVKVETFPLTARSGIDFGAFSESISFAPGEWRKRIRVPLHDNNIAETNRLFEVRLQSAGGVRIAEAQKTTITIVDDDVNVSFAQGVISANEDDVSLKILLRRNGVASGPIRAEILRENNFPIGTVDFPALSTSGVIERSFQMPLTDDDQLKDDIRTTLHLRLSGASPGLVATAQLHVIDNDFSSSPGRGVAGTVHAIVPAPNGGIYLGGDFSSIHGKLRKNAARLLPNGEVDPAFDPQTGPNGPVRTLAVQSDGRIVIAGDFTNVNGISRMHLARLNEDGSLDASFDSGTGPKSSQLEPKIHALTVLSEGKLLIGGSFTEFSDRPAHGIVRLLNDGSIDTTFVSRLTFSSATRPPRPSLPSISSPSIVTELHSLEDGKILAVGELFYIVPTNNPSARLSASLFRLEKNGAIDQSFTHQSIQERIVTLAVLPGGKLAVGRAFEQNLWLRPTTNLMSWVRIDRLLENGAFDSTFLSRNVPDRKPTSAIVRKIMPQGTGHILFLADVEQNISMNRTVYSILGRLLPDGAWDRSFHMVIATDPTRVGTFPQYPFNDPANSPDNTALLGPIHAMAVQQDGTITIGGSFREVNGTPRRQLARIKTFGELLGQFALSLNPTSDGQLILVAEPEIEVPYHIESSKDLKFWSPILTNNTPWKSLEMQTSPDTYGPFQFFRLIDVK